MKQLMTYLLFPLMLLSAGCAPTYPPAVHLDPVAPDALTPIYDGTATARLHSRDQRTTPAVLIYRIGNTPAVSLPNDTGVQRLLAELLVAGFKRQGLRFEGEAAADIRVDIEELAVTVTKPELLYTATAKSVITLKVKKNGGAFTKTYTREGERSSMSRPDVPEATSMLDEQLGDIISHMLSDEDVRAILSR